MFSDLSLDVVPSPYHGSQKLAFRYVISDQYFRPLMPACLMFNVGNTGRFDRLDVGSSMTFRARIECEDFVRHMFAFPVYAT
ncbi:hypothetical protein ABD05_28120 [Burkholderia pyrrocinia]|nr:hypothetical protein ABD05_28120 [Burkholderia pyrrocinia]